MSLEATIIVIEIISKLQVITTTYSLIFAIWLILDSLKIIKFQVTKTSIILCVMSILFILVTPSKNTMYVLCGVSTAKKIINSPQGQQIINNLSK